MTNAHTVNVALAFLTSTHNAEQAALDEIARLREENAKLAAAHAAKPKAPKAAKVAPKAAIKSKVKSAPKAAARTAAKKTAKSGKK